MDFTREELRELSPEKQLKVLARRAQGYLLKGGRLLRPWEMAELVRSVRSGLCE
jgi:hypothetical protein